MCTYELRNGRTLDYHHEFREHLPCFVSTLSSNHPVPEAQQCLEVQCPREVLGWFSIVSGRGGMQRKKLELVDHDADCPHEYFQSEYQRVSMIHHPREIPRKSDDVEAEYSV